jgi:hypothetical protein
MAPGLAGDEDIHWQGLRLVLARLVWVAVAALSVALFFASLSPFYAATLNLTGTHVRNPEAVRAGLEQLGLSLQFFAVLDVFAATLSVLTFVGVGVVIFWRKGGRTRPVVLLAGAGHLRRDLGEFFAPAGAGTAQPEIAGCHR